MEYRVICTYNPLKLPYNPINLPYNPINLTYNPIKLTYNSLKCYYNPVKLPYNPLQLQHNPLKFHYYPLNFPYKHYDPLKPRGLRGDNIIISKLHYNPLNCTKIALCTIKTARVAGGADNIIIL